VKLANDDLAYVNYDVASSPMAPGDSITLSLASKLLISILNEANVLATPCWTTDGHCAAIPDYGNVTHVDSSEVEKLAFDVGVSIENTVLLGAHTGILGREKCPGDEFVEDYPGRFVSFVEPIDSKETFSSGSDISYCFQIKNTGTSYLGEIQIASKVRTLEMNITFSKKGFLPGHGVFQNAIRTARSWGLHYSRGTKRGHRIGGNDCERNCYAILGRRQKSSGSPGCFR
jgi:hypothetical protein